MIVDDAIVVVKGHIKWFDPVKGYGFIVPDTPESVPGGGDVLLHMSVLRLAGFSTIAEGTRIECDAARRDRGVQAIRLLSVDEERTPDIAELSPNSPEQIEKSGTPVADGALMPSRVKWFDKSKGFGFVNMHGDDADVFVHMEVLRRFGLPDLDPGEAVLVRAIEGPRGRMACEVRPWDYSFRTQ